LSIHSTDPNSFIFAMNLFTPIQLGRYTLPNRVIMAPLTRCRAGKGNVPTPLNATYYEQRSSAGLIISEATQVSPRGQGYPNTPGIHSDEQVAGWQMVTDTVHKRGGKIFLQLWHVGRSSHPDFQPNGDLPVAPSAIAIPGQLLTPKGMKPYVAPRALETHEISGIIEEFRQGAENALAAGFDGVEIHGANGYLLDQFLRDGSNQRTDEYGGPIAHRARLTLEITEAVVKVWGSDRVGIRLSPSTPFNGMSDSNPQATFGYLVDQLNRFDLAYLHLTEPSASDVRHGGVSVPSTYFRPIYQGNLMVNLDYDQHKANAAIAGGNADLVSFGKQFIANPDLPERFQKNAPLNQPDPSTFYGGDQKGYTDYLTLEELQTA
jgi:N-ethylmaleimide reductase